MHNQIIHRIFNYLMQYENEGKTFKGVKVFNSHQRAPSLIQRLQAFMPPNVENLLVNMRSTGQPENLRSDYRNLALLAIKEYIREFPFLLHSPSSLRACFGMPTRKDRKMGRYSGVSLINDALDSITEENEESKKNYPNQEVISELIYALEAIIETEKQQKYSKAAHRMIDYLTENLHRNAKVDVYAPTINTHTDFALDFAKEYLLDLNFNNVIHEGEPQYQELFEAEKKKKKNPAELTPDLYGFIWETKIWIEMKEWEKFNAFFKPLKQIFSYLLHASYTAILVEKPVEFYEFLTTFVNPVISLPQFKEALRPYMRHAENASQKAHLFKYKLMNLGKVLIEEENMSYKAETLYLGLLSEINNTEIGMTNFELEAGRGLFRLLEKLERRHKEFRIILLDNLDDYRTKPRQQLVLFLGVLNQNNTYESFIPSLR